MASWAEFESQAPRLAAAVEAVLRAHKHKVLATLRKDGSPRVSGVETEFVDGDLWLAMMDRSRKALDLRRDPRLALHSGSPDPPEDPTTWSGDAKLSGRAVEVTDAATVRRFLGELSQQPPGSFDLFRVELAEVVLTKVGDPADRLVIELWRPGEEVRRMERV